MPLALFIPNLYFSMVVMLFCAGASAALIYQASTASSTFEDEGTTMLVAGSALLPDWSPGVNDGASRCHLGRGADRNVTPPMHLHRFDPPPPDRSCLIGSLFHKR